MSSLEDIFIKLGAENNNENKELDDDDNNDKLDNIE